jgi:hypothetical protein
MPKPEEATSQPKKLPLKVIALILGLLIAEAGIVLALAHMWGKPSEVQGADVQSLAVDQLEQTLELLVVEDRFPNHQTGRVWLWETEIQIQVRQKHREYVERMLEERRAEIKTGVSQIWRNAHQRHLTEPNLETLNRQVSTFLHQLFGQDSQGEQRVQRVLIPKCVGFPADF